MMAAKIFTINMCSTKNDNTAYDFAALIKIFDKERLISSSNQIITNFPNTNETTYDF
jgi:hypothetical protein